MGSALLNPFSPEATKAAKIAELKRQAQVTNASRIAAYTLVSHDWLEQNLHNRDLGIALAPIADPPLMHHVSDDGVESDGPEFLMQKPSLPAPSGVASSVTIGSQAQVAPNQADQILAGLALMWTDIQAIKAKLQA